MLGRKQGLASGVFSEGVLEEGAKKTQGAWHLLLPGEGEQGRFTLGQSRARSLHLALQMPETGCPVLEPDLALRSLAQGKGNPAVKTGFLKRE